MNDVYFAIPGDMHRRTGGFIYEARLLKELKKLGVDIKHVQLPTGFPEPSDEEMRETIATLASLPPNSQLILDGLVFGSIDPKGLDEVSATIVAMLHHPLGLETGLSAERAAFLLKNEEAALERADHVLVTSPHTEQVYREQFGVAADRITIAPPGFDRPLKAVSKGVPHILTIGLLAERKGHDVLLNALGLIKDLDWKSSIVGAAHNADFAARLMQLRSKLQLEERVRFAGEVDDEELASLFRSASIFALATRYEGYGMVFGEAMLHGLPIVTCATGAVPDTVGDAGILVPADDASAFASSLRSLLENSNLRTKLAMRASTLGEVLPRWKDTATIAENVLIGLL